MVKILHISKMTILNINGYYCILMAINGYESIPINTIFRGMNIHKSQLFWCEQKGYKVLTHCQIVMNNQAHWSLVVKLWWLLWVVGSLQELCRDPFRLCHCGTPLRIATSSGAEALGKHWNIGCIGSIGYWNIEHPPSKSSNSKPLLKCLNIRFIKLCRGLETGVGKQFQYHSTIGV